ncbi:hypothetical protein GALMADRAFT_232763 [Galerina marginata CBS 339.88]|uniref:CxC2-like cysteine cluster KDZ transposase-associated domain-containing protein n=1 Tax=Galerina marginata (strain CBS 339.88) TaxID=685588 RepID=A0A067SGV5_GALM3|nr:hypothetical protein GALMADRAFT_232763 [Galerina marginata CBS 339.88]
MSKHSNDSEPSGSTQPAPAKQIWNLPGFRLSRQNEAQKPTPASLSSSSSSSHVKTLSLGTTGRLAGKRKHKSHATTQPPPSMPSHMEPTPIQVDAPLVDVTPDVVEPPEVPAVPINVQVGAKSKRIRDNKTHSKLLEWLTLWDTTLDEILCHDGLGDYLGCQECFACHDEPGVFKCKDCSGGGRLRCQACIVQAHKDTPLHRIEESLKNLGLCVQHGHGGCDCPCPSPGPPGFLVFDTSGIHAINIDYCDCPKDNKLDRRTQLLRQGWFPATFTRPNTVFTFDCLDTFHEHTLQAKGNLYDFYHLLLQKTDNANVSATFYRYKEIHRVFRFWRNLMSLKRTGRGHDPEGIGDTPPGSLTVECPACPHPGQNLPDNWQEAGPLMFLYILYISIDANFKLKSKSRGLKDLELMPGWGPFVEESAYQDYITNYVDEPEINTCESEHNTIVRAQTRCTPGYAVSGVGIVVCSRHALVRRTGAGDLQKGEKYCNMDFIIFAALLGILLPWIFITYNIGCQWSKNFRSCMSDFPEHMQINPETRVDVAIPSWHINGHGKRYRSDFCLGYTPGAGRTCGEEVKITWSATNALGPSIREMAPAARHNTLNDQWNGWNFHKIVGFRTLFSKRFQEAVLMSTRHTEIFEKFSATFPPQTVARWTRMVERWEADPKASNPYDEPEEATMLHDVRLELAQNKTLQLAAGYIPPHKVSMMGFFTMGFDIEDQQFTFKRELSRTKGKKTSKQLADLEEKRSALIRQILIWRPIQLAYTPHVAALLPLVQGDVGDGGGHYSNPESAPLYFPSSIPLNICQRPELQAVCEAEHRLREAQADDALADVRRLHRVIQGLWQFKKLNVSGTGNWPNTWMLNSYSQFESKLQRAANHYRVAHTALIALDPNGAWRQRLQELKPTDLRGPGRDPDHPAKKSNGRFEPSWIWLVPRSPQERGDNQTEDEFNHSMRTEWAQTHAHMCRWKEELLIIQEEMRRVLAFFKWKSAWWLEQASQRETVEPAVQSGIVAYAHKQSTLCLQMAARCAVYWLPVMKKHGIIPTWSDSEDDDEDDNVDNRSDTGEVDINDILDFE